MSNVKVVGLSNGVELIGQVVEDKVGVTLKDTLVIMLNPDQKTGRMGFGFMPYAPLTKSDVKNFPYKDIMWTDEPNDMLLGAYQEATGSVVTPPQSIVLN